MALIPAFVVGLLATSTASKALINQGTGTIQNEAKIEGGIVSNMLERYQTRVKDMAVQVEEIYSRDANGIDDALSMTFRSNKDVEYAYVTDLDGNIKYASESRFLTNSVKDKGYIKEILSTKKAVIGSLEESIKITGKKVIPFANPIQVNNQLFGYAVINVYVEEITKYLKDIVVSGSETGFVSIKGLISITLPHQKKVQKLR